MKINHLHSWDLPPKKAIEIQRDLAHRIVTCGGSQRVRTVAGCDLGFTGDGKEAVACAIVYRYPSLEEIERLYVKAKVAYPYIPGLLSFREGPILEKLFVKMVQIPDVILFDGQGIAHPRRLGIASHMGLLLGVPTIGCAKSRLCGVHDEPGPEVGDWAKLADEKTGDVMGAVLRTRKGVKPIFISAGHMISLTRSIEIVLGCLDKTRIPKPTREADKWVKQLTH